MYKAVICVAVTDLPVQCCLRLLSPGRVRSPSRVDGHPSSQRHCQWLLRVTSRPQATASPTSASER